MVRKDVKLGAVVLGILITVLIVYVLVVSGSGGGKGKPASAGDGEVAAAPAGDEAFKKQMIAGETQLAEIGKTAADPAAAGQPSASNEPAAVNAPAGASPVAANAPGPVKTDPFGPADEKWMMALNNGVVPDSTRLTSSKPQSPATPGSAISAPPVTRTPGAAGTGDSAAAPNTALAINPATRPAGRTHVVQPGENFARIAETVYGSQVYYKDVMAANPGVKPEKLRPGMVINLPDVKEVKGKGNTEDDSPAPAIDARLEYRVQTGDSVHRIAVKLYGNQEMWQDLYDLNKARIGNDPAKLKVGMILKLPKPPTR